ncbi:MAG: hypothetical protein AB7F67_25905 [Rhodospirillaceae bacterium]
MRPAPTLRRLLTALVLALPGAAAAQTRVQGNVEEQLDAARTAETVAIGAPVDDRVGLYALPIPIVDPTIGNGLAVAALMTVALDPDDRISPRSTIAAAFGYTDTQTYAYGAGSSLYFAEDRYRVGLKAGYGDANLKFYGVGSGSPLRDNPIDFGIRGRFASANLRARIWDHVYAGPLYKYLDSTASFALRPDDVRDAEVDYRLSGAGAIAQFDSRDTSFSPHSGTLAELESVRFDRRIGSDFDYVATEGTVAHYRELSPALVAAAQLRVASVFGDAPLFALPYVTLRGFPGGKYIDELAWQVQAEIRWRAFWRIGVVAFIGVGQTAPDIDGLREASLLHSGGAGLRFVVSESERIAFGIDYARASDGETALYFRIGEAF